MTGRSNFALLLALCLCATSAVAVPVGPPRAPPLPTVPSLSDAPNPNDFTFSPAVPPTARDIPDPSVPVATPDTDAGASFNPFKPESRDLSARKHDTVTGVSVLPGTGVTYHKYEDNKRSPLADTVADGTGPLGNFTYHKHQEDAPAPKPKRQLPAAIPAPASEASPAGGAGGGAGVGVDYKHHNERSPEDTSFSVPAMDGADLDVFKLDLRRRDFPPPPPPPPKTEFSIPSTKSMGVNALHASTRRQGPPGPPSPETEFSLPSDSGMGVDTFRAHGRRQGPPPAPPAPKTEFSAPSISGTGVDLFHVGSRRDSTVSVPSGSGAGLDAGPLNARDIIVNAERQVPAGLPVGLPVVGGSGSAPA